MSEQNVNDMLERVLSHVLNDSTAAERKQFESDIAKGDFELELALDRIQRLFANIPAAMHPTPTPAFLKDRLLLRVREESLVALTDAEDVRASAGVLETVLDLIRPVPGIDGGILPKPGR
jgi:hypothetical protein